MSIRAGVGSVVDGLQSVTHLWSASNAPLDADGAHRLPSLLTRELEEIKDVVYEGMPFSFSELVSGLLLLRFHGAHFFYSLRISMP